MFTQAERLEIQVFLALLFSWDDDHSNLYKTVSWTFTKSEGDLGFANFAAQSMDDVMKLISTRYKRPGANVYIALGTQRMAEYEKLSADGFPKAVRKHSNVVSFNSIYLDIDVGKQNAYATTEDAFAALDDFCKMVGMPKPTMEVYSGTGGLHVYWCFDKPVPVKHWTPLARGLQLAAQTYGLKFDPGVTVNPAGILRVPNTFNHKRTPPAKVFLYKEEPPDFPRYGYQQLVAALGDYIGNIGHRDGQTKTNQERSKNFTAGLETLPPVSIDDVAVQCGVIDDILERGGDGDGEPLWNQALYAAAFTEDPHDAAHRLSDGDSRYTHAETEKKLLEKINARAANPDAGWPTCESFSILHPACATCPLFAHGKTPFHHARRPSSYGPTPPPPKDGANFVPSGKDPLMPDGYWRDKNNHVFTNRLNPKTGTLALIEVINYPVLDAGLDEENNLIYKARVSGVDHWRMLSVSANMQPLQAASALARGRGLYVDPKNHTHTRDFLVAWVQHLQTIKRQASQSGYGWLPDGGFAFDDKVYRAAGTETVYKGKHSDPNFCVAGDVKPWQDAMALVYGNMPLETVVASAFAGPLVELTGTSSVVLSIYSSESGVGKSTAMALGQAVWGHPRGGMSTLNDTTNSMMKKIADLHSLPVYWDELRTKDQLEKVIDIVFSVTQGKAKARLNKDTTQQEAPIFTTMFVVASNYGIGDTVFSQTEATDAGGLRILELEATGQSTMISGWDAAQHLRAIERNYGGPGAAFAEYLAKNRSLVLATLDAISTDLESRHHFTPKERFWQRGLTALFAGAALANHAGLTQFDLAGLQKYLDQVLTRHRSGMKKHDYATLRTADDALGLLQEMVTLIRGKHLIITEIIPYGVQGRPPVNNLVDTDLSRLQDIWFQKGDKDGRIRAQVRSFNKWLRERRINPGKFVEQLGAHFHVHQSKQTIGSGVPGLDATTTVGRAECYDFIPINAGTNDSSEPS